MRIFNRVMGNSAHGRSLALDFRTPEDVVGERQVPAAVLAGFTFEWSRITQIAQSRDKLVRRGMVVTP